MIGFDGPVLATLRTSWKRKALVVSFFLSGDSNDDFPAIALLAYETKLSVITRVASADRNFKDCDRLLFRSGYISCYGKYCWKISFRALSGFLPGMVCQSEEKEQL